MASSMLLGRGLLNNDDKVVSTGVSAWFVYTEGCGRPGVLAMVAEDRSILSP